MVKKLKYLLFFIPFLFTLNVNAMLLGTPNSYAHFNDDTITGPSNATIIGYWGTDNYYKSPYLMGGVSSASYVNQIDFNWNNANLCPNDDISISGSIAGIYNLFTEQSTSFSAYNNNSSMACVTSFQENGSRLDYSCYGKGGGNLSLYVQMNSFSLVNQYQVGVTRNMTVSCDASNLDVIQNATNNTNSIINNNNQNTQDIIDNQNDNTDTLNDSLNSMCKDTTLDITTDLTSEVGKYLDPNGSLISYSSSYVSKYIKLKPNTPYTIKRITGGSQPNNVSYCLYNANKALYSCSTMPSENSSVTFTADNYSSFLRVSFLGYRAVQVEGSICNDWSAEAQQDIINNNNNNTNQIIQDNQQNTQDIIDNQNANTDKEIESQKVCNSYDRSSIEIDNSFLQSNGTVRSSSSGNYGVSKYIKISSTSVVKLLNHTTSTDYLCFYDVNKVFISCTLTNVSDNTIFTIPPNSSYFRFTTYKPISKPIIQVCSNGNQFLNDSVNDLNDSITSEDNPNTNQDINDMNNMVASDTPISDLITMPLTLINAYINGVNASCSPINLGNLYGTDLILPCINLEQRLGSNLWHIIDAFFSLFMCYNIGMLFITAFDGITSLRDDFEGLYQPRHADTGYQPKHGG